VMGFVILAAMLKYLSSLDQVLQWNLLTRERFLAAWIVLFSMAGLYLLGYVRLEGIKPDEPMGLGRLLTGMTFVIFAISLTPGMFGARLGELDGYVPVATNSPALGGGGGAESKLVWLKNQYREALAKARAEGKLVFVNFTGYACTNCHWMKANMFPRPEIAGALGNYVLVELYTDGSDDASQVNQQLEESKFKTIAIPFYAILDPDENVIAQFGQQTRDAKEFLAFVEKGAGPRPAAGAPVVAAAGKPDGPLAGVPITTLDGGAFDAAALSGKVVVVNFWATWCIPCIKEIPSFNKIHKELAGKGVAVLGVSMDDEDAPAKVKTFLTKHPMEYAVALGSDKVGEKFQLSNYPVTVVFDRTGKLLKRFEGFTPEQSLEDAVKTAL
jgi:thiol-disulfide isomerase/thioredoxin